jgi:hypothetical protein
MNFELTSHALAEWLTALSVPERIRALAVMYSGLTICTRELFFPETTGGKAQVVLYMLNGINEMHHTLANFLLRWTYEEGDWPPEVLSQQLVEIASQYRVGRALKESVEFARTADLKAKKGGRNTQ